MLWRNWIQTPLIQISAYGWQATRRPISRCLCYKMASRWPTSPPRDCALTSFDLTWVILSRIQSSLQLVTSRLVSPTMNMLLLNNRGQKEAHLWIFVTIAILFLLNVSRNFTWSEGLCEGPNLLYTTWVCTGVGGCQGSRFRKKFRGSSGCFFIPIDSSSII